MDGGKGVVAADAQVVAATRAAFKAGKPRPLAWRRQQLLGLIQMVDKEQAAFAAAAQKDLHKAPEEVYSTELLMLRNDAIEAIESTPSWLGRSQDRRGGADTRSRAGAGGHTIGIDGRLDLNSWTAAVHPTVTLMSKLDDCRILQDPLGVVLIIGAWNYPFQLTLVPLVGAIAAGNCVVIKPSEVSPHSAQLMADLLPKYVDPECIKVVNGAVAETTLLLQQKFDHILYTGNSNVGKIIMAAAAMTPCPVTLELGGKSPCIVDADSDFTIVGRRIAWGRYLNAGQTCIAPDYVLALPGTEDKLVAGIQTAVREFWGENPQQSAGYGRIVNRST